MYLAHAALVGNHVVIDGLLMVMASTCSICSVQTLAFREQIKQWEGMGDVGSARYELALLPPGPTIRVLSYSN